LGNFFFKNHLHLQDAVINLFDDWENLAREKGKLQYQQEVGDGNPPLLFSPLDSEPRSSTAKKFKAQRSLRDVEQSVSLWIQRPDGQDFGDES
jgi:hypothetical protein